MLRLPSILLGTHAHGHLQIHLINQPANQWSSSTMKKKQKKHTLSIAKEGLI